MLEKLSLPLLIIGCLLFIVGFLFGSLYFITGATPFSSSRYRDSNNASDTYPIILNNGDIYVEYDLITNYYILKESTKTYIKLLVESSGSFSIDMIYSPNVGPSITAKSREFTEDGSIKLSIIMAGNFANVQHSIGFSVNNTSGSTLTITRAEAGFTCLYSALLFPGYFLILGGIIIGVGLLMQRGKSKTKVKPIQWEPTLDSSYNKKPIKKEKEPKVRKKTKPVKNISINKGNMMSCKFCGQFISDNSFYCPKCYGKLK